MGSLLILGGIGYRLATRQEKSQIMDGFNRRDGSWRFRLLVFGGLMWYDVAEFVGRMVEFSFLIKPYLP